MVETGRELTERRTNMGWLFMLLAMICFLLGGMGATVIPNPTTWGLFCMALAFLLGGVSVSFPNWTNRGTNP